MTRFMNEDSHDPHDTQDEASDHFDQVLDGFLHGDPDALNDLDPQMRATVVQMYQWADLAGVGQANLPEVAMGEIPGVTPAPPPSAVPAPIIPIDYKRQRRRSSPGRLLMTTLTGIAAALILGLGIYGAIPVFTDHDQNSGPTEIAFLAPDNGTPETTATHNVPPDVIYAGNTPISTGSGEFVPPQGTELTGVQGSDVRNPVAPEECVVDAITRQQALAILGTPPGTSQSDLPTETDQGATVEEATLTELQAVYREWQACRRFGDTYQAMALQTDQLIRNDIYGTSGYLDGRAGQTVAYSESTLNELLDARETADAVRQQDGEERAQHNAGAEDGLLMHLWVIDTSTMIPGDAAGSYGGGADGGNWIQVPVVWQSPLAQNDPDHPLPLAYVNFKKVDGQWKVSDVYIVSGPSMDGGPSNAD